MRKKCTFEENSIRNFEMEEEFDQLMQIEGLGSTHTHRKELFPSIKHIFRPQTAVNIVGDGPNANIKSFYYLLLCHIRKEHFKKLVTEFKQKQLDDDEELVERRDRRVSFNDKGALFLNGPQYENYCLHLLKNFAFSKETDLTMITNSPFNNDPTLRFKGEKLTSLMMKKLLSEFLKELLPATLAPNYKEEIRSVKYQLNRHKCIGIIFTILMRFILLSKYQIESARNYEEEVNDHTVCTTLCDAFAIDGLICKDNLYEINTWCKVHSVEHASKKTFFIEMFNDEFEELGSNNERRISIASRKQVEKQVSVASNLQSSEEQGKSAAFGYQNSVVSSSIMAADEDSQVASSSSEKKSSSPSSSNQASSKDGWKPMQSSPQANLNQFIKQEPTFTAMEQQQATKSSGQF